MKKIEKKLRNLAKEIQGDLLIDNLSKAVYSTDASAYRETPLGVVLPKTKEDIFKIVSFAKENKISLIPRGAGTSLAGQVVGDGLVVDISRYFKKIIEVNTQERWVRVEPGVVLDELNNYLKPYGLFFGPETSTGNRCTIGGMVGNNSCGSHSLIYGSTRDHLLSSKIILSDSKEIEIKSISAKEFEEKKKKEDLEGRIYKYIWDKLSNEETRKEIEETFPDKEIRRRNNGYALDELIDNNIFNPESTNAFNLSKLFAGSEGTLAFGIEFKLNLSPLPPKEKAVICAHFDSLEESFEGNLIALGNKPYAIELMDNNILESASRNISQKKNMFFVSGNPKAILIIELAEETPEELDHKISSIIQELKSKNLGYAYPVLKDKDIPKVWELRKAGLGLLTNIPGSAKPVSVIEDTAVSPKMFSSYIKEFKEILKKYDLECVYHAHIATGELHLRPILDLKKRKDIEIFRNLSIEVAELVRKYRGSLSGEHGDGRLRGEFIPLMYGEKIYSLMKEIKEVWDGDNIFNKGKIIDTPKMNTFLRYDYPVKKDKKYLEPNTIISDKEFRSYYDFSEQKDFLSAIEQCNGSADCRKGIEFLGTMCPSYRATNDERFTPRARANALREHLSYSKENNPFDSKELYWILDNCLSCKGCKSECPSNVDIAKLKSEFLQHYYNANGIPLRVILINYLPFFQRLTSSIPWFYNWLIRNQITSYAIKKVLRFSLKRPFPLMNNYSLRRLSSKLKDRNTQEYKKKIYFFADEFTNYQDAEIGFSALELFISLGYKVEIPPIRESGRIAMSKGWVKRAKSIANKNYRKLKDIISEDTPLIGIEPSTILSFKDEYPSLIKNENISKHCLLFDEFLAMEIDNGNIISSDFSEEKQNILLHGHCQQKAIIGTGAMEKVLTLPKNYKVEVIPSGCCGMAGSFGYEEKNYEISKNIGEQILFPAILKAEEERIISAPGTSCREHIKHFTNKQALHPIEILWNSRKLRLGLRNQETLN